MIKFFRAIRQNMINQNKVSRYLIYAFGEIFLVVIGILIALSLNNWNENEKQNKTSAEYHQRIHEDLQRLIAQSENVLNTAEKTLKSITKTVELLESGVIKTNADQESLDFALIWFSRTNYRMPELPTYEEMKSNGDLNLIRDIELRNQMAAYNNFINQVESVVSKLSNAIESNFRIYNKYIRTYADPKSLEVTYKYDFKKMAADPEFINTFSRLSYYWRGYVYFMQRIIMDAEKLEEKFKEKLVENK